MDHEVEPARTLLDSEVPPLSLRHQVGLGHETSNVRGQDYMSVKIINDCSIPTINLIQGNFDCSIYILEVVIWKKYNHLFILYELDKHVES